jgi:hypothetical protein
MSGKCQLCGTESDARYQCFENALGFVRGAIAMVNCPVCKTDMFCSEVSHREEVEELDFQI